MPSYNLDLFNSDIDDPIGLAPTFTVSDFVAAINQSLSAAYPEVYVEGEVSSFTINQGKFVFFDLKDEKSSISCFLMLFDLKTPLEDGMQIRVKATPKLTDKGRFSLTVKSIKLSGEGTLKRAYELLKAKLDKEGLFDPARKRPLPQFPTQVSIVTSKDSAGYADFKKIADDRWGGVEFQIAHVQVQGENSPAQIIRALTFVNEQKSLPDVIVLIRGGGSLEDLSSFNDEEVTRAIAGSRVPTLVGVGHEVDITLAGLAADVRASTPSNAAQILLPDRYEISSRITTWADILEKSVERLISGKRDDLLNRMSSAFENILVQQEDKIGYLKRALKAYDPRDILKRGYSIARLKGRVVRSGKQVKASDALMLELIDATVDTEVKNVESK